MKPGDLYHVILTDRTQKHRLKAGVDVRVAHVTDTEVHLFVASASPSKWIVPRSLFETNFVASREFRPGGVGYVSALPYTVPPAKRFD